MELRPGYKQTEVGVIPEDWEVARLGDFCTCFSGGTPSTANPNYYNGQIPWITSSDLNSFRIREVEGRITHEGLTNSSAKMVDAGTLLLALYGATTGVAAVTEIAAAINQAVLAIQPRKHNTEYLLAYFRLQRESLVNTYTQGGQPNFSGEIVKSFLVPLPSKTCEQEAIAEALSDADALIEGLEQLIAKKRRVKQGAMEELLTGKKRLPGFEGQWRKRLLGDVIFYCSSGATPYRGHPEYYKGEVKWITSGELNYNLITDTVEKISEEAVEKTHLKVHPVGTFLMAITGLEAEGTRGACGIVGSPATTNQSCMAIYPTSELTTPYLFHYYTLRGKELALRYCQGTKQQSYTARLVKLLPVDLPPSTDEQNAIATVLSDMDAELSALEAKLAKARQVKEGMMQDLLTGRVRLV